MRWISRLKEGEDFLVKTSEGGSQLYKGKRMIKSEAKGLEDHVLENYLENARGKVEVVYEIYEKGRWQCEEKTDE